MIQKIQCGDEESILLRNSGYNQFHAMFYCEISAYIAFYHPYRLLFLQKEIQVGFELAKKTLGKTWKRIKFIFNVKCGIFPLEKKASSAFHVSGL